VGFLIHRDEACNISDWKYMSEKGEKGEAEVTPNETKENYFDQLQNTTNDIILLEDLNGRLGAKPKNVEGGLVKEAKRAECEEFGNFLKEIFSENYKLFCKTLKRTRQPGKFPIQYILKKEGKVLRNEEGVTERWREYFSEWEWRRARRHRTGF
ncbi:hypothetical protein ILUMI_15177, partial [Ignelater luminosus]